MRAPKLVFFALLLMVTVVLAQQPARHTGVLLLRVLVKADDSAPLRGLARKRFFLIPGTIEQNRALIDAIERQALLSRDCYSKKMGQAPAQLTGFGRVIASRFIVAVSNMNSSADQRPCRNSRPLLPRARRSMETMKRRGS